MLEVTLTAEKVTKNTVRFREEDPGPGENKTFPVIYIQKSAVALLGSTTPEKIKVTVEVVK